MKKSLLALAVLGAFASAASAQSSVTLSGVVDAGVRRIGINSPTSGYDWSLGGSTSSANSFTLSGREDLGGGMTAGFNLQHRFSLNNGRINSYGNTFWRRSYLTLGGNFGEVRLGRFDMPLQDVNGAFDPWAVANVADTHTGGITATIRANNAIGYTTPSIGGLKVFVAIAAAEGQSLGQQPTGSFGSNADETANNFGSRANFSLGQRERPLGVALRYTAGPLDVSVAYDRNIVGTKTSGVYGAFDFRVFKLMGQFEKGDGSYYWRDATAAVTGFTGTPARYDEELKLFSIGATIPLGPVVAKVGYVRVDSNRAGMDGTKFGFGGDYFLSKRTKLYSTVGKMSGDRFAPGSPTSGKLSDNVNQRKAMFDIGIRHNF